MHCSGCRKLLL
ncbi:MAG: hypothetical protein EOL87_01760 [Spartobacteria bacterium]|nr:hypothetical protein [Spartobacteria bacterium]